MHALLYACMTIEPVDDWDHLDSVVFLYQPVTQLVIHFCETVLGAM